MQEIAAVIVRSASGLFLVHRRSASRRTYPGRFGLGAGGKVEPGEQIHIAAARELREETGIVAEPQHRFSFDFKDGEHRHRLHLFDTIVGLEAVVNDLSWDSREWDSCEWMTTEAVDELDGRGALCPDTSLFYRRYRKQVPF